MLTGNTRMRRSLFGKVIMQVEYTQRGKRVSGLSHPSPRVRRWRDATWHDIENLEEYRDIVRYEQRTQAIKDELDRLRGNVKDSRPPLYLVR